MRYRDLLSRLYPSSRSTLATATLLLLAMQASAAVAQRRNNPFPPNQNPFADPQKFFEQFFGADSEEDREAIQEIEIAPREERQIGSRGVDAYLADLRRQRIKVTTRGKDVEYLQQLIAELRPQMQNQQRYRAIRVYVADADRTDARSFPGGTLIFFRGMLEFAENEAALVGVIGHELSHLDRGHQLYDAKRMKLAQQTFSGADGFSPDKFFKDGAMLMRSFTRPFRPEEEAEADRDGVRWAYQAGYDPREMAQLFLRMHERDGDSGARAAPAFFRTHPYSIDRYQAALDQYDQLQTDAPRAELYVGRENLRQRVPRSVREFEE